VSGVTRVLVVDNYDSFTYNLVQELGELGADIEVVRNDAARVDELLASAPDRVVVSPGPCTPNEAGISLEVVRRFPEAGIPLLGVCLGHQALAQAFGGTVVRHEPVHGKTTTIAHDGRTLFADLPSPLTVGRSPLARRRRRGPARLLRGERPGGRGDHGDPPPRAPRRRPPVPSRVGPHGIGYDHPAELPRRGVRCPPGCRSRGAGGVYRIAEQPVSLRRDHFVFAQNGSRGLSCRSTLARCRRMWRRR
jgi:anthranilate/para-aminobenzoate synthase component II